MISSDIFILLCMYLQSDPFCAHLMLPLHCLMEHFISCKSCLIEAMHHICIAS